MTEKFELQSNMVMAFGTPVVAYQWPDSDELNAQLQALILAKEQGDRAMVRSNRGGWHSDITLLEWGGPAIKTFADRCREIVSVLTKAIVMTQGKKRQFNFQLAAWANVNRRNSYNQLHGHPDSFWSGVYYVNSGTPDEGWDETGKLELVDPRGSINMIGIKDSILEGRFLVDPIPGLMVVFPSWLKHFVHPYYGDGERISIAFNARVEEKLKK